MFPRVWRAEHALCLGPAVVGRVVVLLGELIDDIGRVLDLGGPVEVLGKVDLLNQAGPVIEPDR